MSTDTRSQLAGLRRLSMGELKQRWRDLIGTDPPQYSRSFLVSRLAYRLQELSHRGLSPSALADGVPASARDCSNVCPVARMWAARHSAPQRSSMLQD
jgi:hypothetical protein